LITKFLHRPFLELCHDILFFRCCACVPAVVPLDPLFSLADFFLTHTFFFFTGKSLLFLFLFFISPKSHGLLSTRQLRPEHFSLGLPSHRPSVNLYCPLFVPFIFSHFYVLNSPLPSPRVRHFLGLPTTLSVGLNVSRLAKCKVSPPPYFLVSLCPPRTFRPPKPDTPCWMSPHSFSSLFSFYFFFLAFFGLSRGSTHSCFVLSCLFLIFLHPHLLSASFPLSPLAPSTPLFSFFFFPLLNPPPFPFLSFSF